MCETRSRSSGNWPTGSKDTRMKEVLEDVERWLAAGEDVAISTVVAVKRSAPRPPGAKMAGNGSGEASGAVSGASVAGAEVEGAVQGVRGKDHQLKPFALAAPGPVYFGQ